MRTAGCSTAIRTAPSSPRSSRRNRRNRTPSRRRCPPNAGPPPPPPEVEASPFPTTPPPPPPKPSTVTVTAPAAAACRTAAAPPEEPVAPAAGPGGGEVPPVPGPPPGSPDGVVGVAPDAALISVRQSSSAFGPARPQPGDNDEIRRKAGDIATLARAVVHLANLGVKVMNISVTACVNAAQPIDQAALGAAIRYAAVEKDIVIVAAAGNEGEGSACGQNPLFNPLAGRATPATGRTCRPSSPPPGSPITSSRSARCRRTASHCRRASRARGWASRHPASRSWAFPASTGRRSTRCQAVNPGKAVPLSGTSFATAYTSGVAALVRAKYPQLSAHQIIRRITETAHNPPRGVDNKVGYGVIDPVAALTFDVPPGDRLAPEHLTKLLQCARAATTAGSAAAAHRADRCSGRRRARRRGRGGRGGSAEALMKARTIGINASIPVVVGVEVAVLAAILIFPPGRWSWWPTAATAVVAILLLMLTVYRRNVVKWLVDRIRWRRRRRRAESPVPQRRHPARRCALRRPGAGQVRRRRDHDDRGDRPGVFADAADRVRPPR